MTALDSVQTGGTSSRRVAAGRPAARKGGRAFLAVPLVLVNLAAIWGQAGWATDHLNSGPVVGVMFALAVESIGVYLAWESHEALLNDQASAGLRFGSYAVGVLAGVLNYWHFSSAGQAQAIAFGCLSAISPWLWAIWSRARNRARLAELGLTDTRGVKLSTSRKLWHPVRSVRVISWAAWEGVTDPAEAVSGWAEAQRKPSEAPRKAPEAVQTPREPVTAPVPVVERLEAPEDRKARIVALRAAEPALSAEAIGKRVGVSGRRVRQVLAEVAS